jgi:hypothetical protein
MDMMRTKPGLTTASKTPRRKRFVAMPPKVLQAGVVMINRPQTKVPSHQLSLTWSENRGMVYQT